MLHLKECGLRSHNVRSGEEEGSVDHARASGDRFRTLPCTAQFRKMKDGDRFCREKRGRRGVVMKTVGKRDT